MGRGGGKGRVWKTKEGIMKTSGIVDRGEDTIRNFEKSGAGGGTHTALPWEGVFQVAVKGQGLIYS